MGAASLMTGLGILSYIFRGSLRARLSRLTRLPDFDAPPPLIPHDPIKDRSRVLVAHGGTPAGNVDSVLDKAGGISRFVGERDVVIVKVSAQWWNQGMTNVAAVKRLVEHVLERPGFSGEVVLFENTHFRLADGSGLSRAWTRPSDRNVDVSGWSCMGDLLPHFAERKAAVSAVGLVDAGPSLLAGDGWHDPAHTYGVYGGEGRGPIAEGEDRDGYHWNFAEAFSLKRSLVDAARTPLSWPRFTSPHSGVVIDLRDGLFRRESNRLVPLDDRKLTFINMTTVNEHTATGMTAACKSPMGIVDMSAGEFGTHPRSRGYQSVHYFGAPKSYWRMAGPLAHFATKVRAPDLILSVAEWISITPRGGWDQEKDIRLDAASAVRTSTVVAGTDPVAIDTWCARNLLMTSGGVHNDFWNLDDPGSRLTRFLRYYRQVRGQGTMAPELIEVA
jgi:hypothetical protein